MTSRATRDADLAAANQLRRRAWAKEAPRYDRRMGFFEARILGRRHRQWACAQAQGKTLEVAVGTGLNVPLYPTDIELTGLDLSDEMLEIARARAHAADRRVDLEVGDAHALPFEADSFDTVVCTYSLCNIPEPSLAVAEMARVARPGGRVVLVDHIRSDIRPILWVQKTIELFSKRSEGEHMTRRSLEHVVAAGLRVTERERLGPGGIVERILAEKPATS